MPPLIAWHSAVTDEYSWNFMTPTLSPQYKLAVIRSWPEPNPYSSHFPAPFFFSKFNWIPSCKLFSHNQFLLNINKSFHAEKSESPTPNCCNYKENVIFQLSCLVLQPEQISIVRIYTEKNILPSHLRRIVTKFPLFLGSSDRRSEVLIPKSLYLSCSSYPSSDKAA